MKPGDRAVIWRERYCEEPKWAGRTIVLASEPLMGMTHTVDYSSGKIYGNRNRFVYFFFEDDLNDPERERYHISIKAIQKIKTKFSEPLGSWDNIYEELNWRPVA